MDVRIAPHRLNPVIHRVEKDALRRNCPYKFSLFVKIDVIEPFTAIPEKERKRLASGLDSGQTGR
jgi:hypothetical protein